MAWRDLERGGVVYLRWRKIKYSAGIAGAVVGFETWNFIRRYTKLFGLSTKQLSKYEYITEHDTTNKYTRHGDNAECKDY
jgi:hypothetical protein